MQCGSCNLRLPETEFDLVKNGSRLKKFCRSCCKKLSDDSRRGNALQAASLDGNSYASRAVVLKKLGFDNYKSYLQSPLWSSIRERVFASKGRRCCLCFKPGNQVHHIRYDERTMRGESLKKLRVLCGDCHLGIEFDDDKKLAVLSAKMKYKSQSRIVIDSRRMAPDDALSREFRAIVRAV